ncbi:pitrilysin family protein [Nakamurella aerolata]|uniref:M16 family metallopeptidase n=1 Tax=Nakamurella aerolata TaxID=1656892 RepID=UPI0031B5CF6D
MTVRTRSTRVLERSFARQDPGVSAGSRSGRAGSTRGAAGCPITLSVTDGGLRIVTEQVPGVRSVAVGIWVGVGSVDERPQLAGTSHFLEHLLFKGTSHRSGAEIAAEMDAIGGEFNAFTSHEYTCYYTHVLAEHAELAIDVVSDVVLDATVAGSDVEVERQVILEEIAMRDDDPEDTLADVFAESVYAPHPVAAPVIGNVRSIEALRRNQIAGYYHRRYTPDKMVVAVAGDIDHADVVRWVKHAFAGRLHGSAGPQPPRGRTGLVLPQRALRVVERDSEQAHLMVGAPALPRDDPRRYALAVLTTALGGGMSSRLFQRVREQYGLAYSCYAGSHSYADAGAFSVYAGCQPGNLDQVSRLIHSELAELATGGVSDDEVQRAIGQLTGSLVLGLEDTESRMSRIGRNIMVRKKFQTVDDELAGIRGVRAEQVNELAAALLAQPLSVAVVGPYSSQRSLPAGVRALAGARASDGPDGSATARSGHTGAGGSARSAAHHRGAGSRP